MNETWLKNEIRKLIAERDGALARACQCANDEACKFVRERDEARAEVERLENRVRKLESDLAPLVVLAAEVNAIRNSIVGTQSLNWSEHAYPLVAALQKAGVSGLPYPEARARMGTLIERATKAEAEVERLRDDVKRGLRIANDLTLETQTVEEACVDLVRQVREARAEVERLQVDAAAWRALEPPAAKREWAALRSQLDATLKQLAWLQQAVREHLPRCPLPRADIHRANLGLAIGFPAMCRCGKALPHAEACPATVDPEDL